MCDYLHCTVLHRTSLPWAERYLGVLSYCRVRWSKKIWKATPPGLRCTSLLVLYCDSLYCNVWIVCCAALLQVRWSKQIWKASPSADGRSVTFTYQSKDGESG
jgi:hypothetical protein